MEIKIYTIPTCPWCTKAKEWLKKRKVSFQDCDVSESQNSQYRDELLEKTGQLGVPVTDFNGILVIGFNEKKLEEALERAKKK